LPSNLLFQMMNKFAAYCIKYRNYEQIYVKTSDLTLEISLYIVNVLINILYELLSKFICNELLFFLNIERSVTPYVFTYQNV